jgi:hypothetical protein
MNRKKPMKSKHRLGLGLALAGLSSIAVPACGSEKEGSLTDQGGSAGTSAGGKGGSGFQLGTAGDGDLVNPSGGDGSGLGEGGGCGSTRIVANPPIVNVLLVVDKSLSMDDKPLGFADTKWVSLRDALATTLDQTQDKINYGLDLFPYSGKSGSPLPTNGECHVPALTAPVVVPVQGGTQAAPLILAALDKNPPGGQTPTALALMRAYAYFKTGAGKALAGDKYVLLATDGGPNCNPDPDVSCEAATCTVNMDGKCMESVGNCCAASIPGGPTTCLDQDTSVAAVKSLLVDVGVKTIVVGIPGTEAYVDTLNALAAESGVTNPDAPPGYFAVSAASGVAGLADALGHITTGLVKSCELHLDEEPPDRDHLFVVVDGVALTEDDPDGWTIPDPDLTPPVIQITGATCEKLETDGAEYINVTYGCPQYDPPVK